MQNFGMEGIFHHYSRFGYFVSIFGKQEEPGSAARLENLISVGERTLKVVETTVAVMGGWTNREEASAYY